MSFQFSLFDSLSTLFNFNKKRTRVRKQIRRPNNLRKTSRVRQDSKSFDFDIAILSKTWLSLRAAYFPTRPDLDTYHIKWSARRQKRTLASCNINRRIVNVAMEMHNDICREYLEPLIYHEMCHAVLGKDVARSGSKIMWHGSEFRALEARHPKTRALELWIKSGGWAKAVRSHRSKEYHQQRKAALLSDRSRPDPS